MAPWEEHPDKPYVQPFPVPLVFFGAPPGSTTGARPGLIGRPHKGIIGRFVSRFLRCFGFRTNIEANNLLDSASIGLILTKIIKTYIVNASFLNVIFA